MGPTLQRHACSCAGCDQGWPRGGTPLVGTPSRAGAHARGGSPPPATCRHGSGPAGCRARERAGARGRRPPGRVAAADWPAVGRLAGSVGWPLIPSGFRPEAPGSTTGSCPVQHPKDRFSPGSFFNRLQCRVEHCSCVPTALGRSFWPPGKTGRSSTLSLLPL
jgi:hypothetical protein